MNVATLAILGIGTVVAVLGILAAAAAQLRDEIVNQGWVGSDSTLARMSRRAQKGSTKALIETLGLTAGELEEIRAARPRSKRKARRVDSEITHRPDKALLRRVKAWIYELDNPYRYGESRYYLDMMGAYQGRQTYEPSFSQIFDPWIQSLEDHGVIEHFDVILAPKDGNPMLAAETARALDCPLILCKGEADHSRVRRPEVTVPHETDFEGLRSYLDQQGDNGVDIGLKLRAIILDDSCKNGSNVISIAKRFNSLISLANGGGYPFHPVKDVVVLFRVKGDHVDDSKLKAAGLRVNALIAVGPSELERIYREDPDRLVDNMGEFKQDRFACSQSLAIYMD